MLKKGTSERSGTPLPGVPIRLVRDRAEVSVQAISDSRAGGEG